MESQNNKPRISLTNTLFITIIIAIIVGLVLINDSKEQVKAAKEQSQINGRYIEIMNKTLLQDINAINNTLIDFINDRNVAFNDTLESQSIILQKQIENEELIINLSEKIDNNSLQSLKNQEEYFGPYFNESFNKIYDALNITDTKSKFTLNGHTR